MIHPDRSLLFADFIPTLSLTEQEFVNTYQIFSPESEARLPAGDMYQAWARDIYRRAHIWLWYGP